jgi:neutral ceramidase
VLGGALRPLGTVTAARQRTIELPLERAVTREQLSERLKNDNALVRYTASKFIQQLDRDRGLPANVPYPVQTWCFGSDLAMVFLGGEVVSEYSLRLRRELDATRLWVNAYANSVPCYIASRRMFEEGGYEVDASMNFYGWPIRLSAKTEELIIETVHQLVPTELKTLR